MNKTDSEPSGPRGKSAAVTKNAADSEKASDRFRRDEDFKRIRHYVDGNPDVTLEEIEGLDEAALTNFERKSCANAGVNSQS